MMRKAKVFKFSHKDTYLVTSSTKLSFFKYCTGWGAVKPAGFRTLSLSAFNGSNPFPCIILKVICTKVLVWFIKNARWIPIGSLVWYASNEFGFP